MPLTAIKEALADFRAGKMVIIVDDEDRENEGDLAIAAAFATPEAINFMAREGRGLVCVALAPELVDRLQLPLMVPSSKNRSGFGTNFTVSAEARKGVTTGISAYDRAQTVSVLIDPTSTPDDIVTPGHVFPLRAHPEGVLGRRGQTEASVDLARLARLTPAAVICEVMAPDGTMARRLELEAFAARHDLKIVSVAMLEQYRQQRERRMNGSTEGWGEKQTPVVTRVASACIPTAYGNLRVTAYADMQRNEHLALSHGPLNGRVPLVRVHSECITGDLLGSLRCDCGDQLKAALCRIGQAEHGLLIYLRQEGRGIGLANKIRAYALQDQGLDTVEANLALGFPADGREFGVAAAILRDQGVQAVRLLTNNPQKVTDLRRHGIEVVERVPHQVGLRTENEDYLRTKAGKLAHFLDIETKE